MCPEYRTSRREHVDEWPGAAAPPAADRDDVAVSVKAHAFDAAMRSAMIGTEHVQHDRMIERAVVADRIRTQFAALAVARLSVGDIKRLLVRRQQHGARADRVVGEPRRHPGAAVVAGEPQHRAMIEERKDRRPEWDDRMTRVGEVEPVLPVGGQVARLVVILAVEQRIDRYGAAVRRELDQSPPALLRAVDL